MSELSESKRARARVRESSHKDRIKQNTKTHWRFCYTSCVCFELCVPGISIPATVSVYVYRFLSLHLSRSMLYTPSMVVVVVVLLFLV